MFGRAIELFKIFGLPIRLDYSWFILAVLITWSLASQFRSTYEQLSPATAWTMGAAGALGLFVSIVLHELGHALVARRFGVPMKGITLFIFGGVAEMSQEPPSARAEFLVAVAGPAVSVALALGGFGVQFAGGGAGWPQAVLAVVAFLAQINLLLVLFNAIPAFPLDGGRVLRSLLWSWKDDLRWATRVSSRIGSLFGLGLIFLGVWVVVAQESFIQGMWFFLIGLFLRNAAQMSYQQLLVRRALEGEPVSRFMVTEPIAVPRHLAVSELVEDYVYRYHHKLFPVVDGERLIGCVTTRRVRELPRQEWDRQSVGALAEPVAEDNTIAPDTDAMEALSLMSRNRSSRLMVADGERLVGIIALKDMLRFLSLKMELEGDAGDAGGEA